MWFKFAEKMVLADKHSEYFFHGTDGRNIPLILSQGLNKIEGKEVWKANKPQSLDELATAEPQVFNTSTQGKRSQGLSMKSLAGTYFSTNYMTSLGYAQEAIRERARKTKMPFAQQDKEPVGIIVAKIETSSPHVFLDDDRIRSTFEISIARYREEINNKGDWYFKDFEDCFNEFRNMDMKEKSRRIITEFIDFTNIDTKNYAKEHGETQIPELNEQFVENLVPYGEQIIKTMIDVWLAQRLIVLMQRATKELAKETKEEAKQFKIERQQKIRQMYDTLGGLQGADNNHEQALEAFFAKSQRLTYRRDTFDTSIRSSKPVGFKGANKIVLATEITMAESGTRICDIKYMSDERALQLLIEQHKQRMGGRLIVMRNGTKIGEFTGR